MSQGVMYVEILPSTKGIGKAVEKDTTAAFKGAGKESDGFFAKVGKGLKRIGVGIVAAGALVTGIAVKGGISRALNIEDAQAKLKGLGHDTKSVEQIMTDALGAVKGTAFGLDAAATTAASAVAAGIKPGKELEKYLRLTADAATIAGVSMDEMGDLMNKVAAKGKVSAREINQFTERGIPILQMLAEEYGVTTEAMSEMVTKGEVDAERFRKALEKNVGGAALASGDTTRGAFANMMAALSRLGETFVGEALGGAKTFFQEVTIIFDGLNERIKPWVEKFQGKLGEMFQIEGMGENFLNWLDETFEKVASGPIPQLLAALAPLMPVLGEAARLVGSALGDAFFELGEAIAPVLPLLAEALTDAVVELAPPLTDLLLALIPLIPALIELIPPIVELALKLLPVLIWAIEKLSPVLIWATENVENIFTMIDMLFGLLDGSTTPEDFVRRGQEMGGAMGWLLDKLEEVGEGMFNFANTVREKIDTARNKFDELKNRIQQIFSNPIGWLTSAGRDVVQGLINGVREKFGEAVETMKNLGAEMLAGAKNFLGIKSPSRVFRDEVGKMVGLGLLDGVEDTTIRGRIDSAVNHLVDVPDVLAGVGSAGSSTFNLFDENGTLWATFRGALAEVLPSRSSVRMSLPV